MLDLRIHAEVVNPGSISLFCTARGAAAGRLGLDAPESVQLRMAIAAILVGNPTADRVSTPVLVDTEVLSALRRLERLGQINSKRVALSLETYRLMPVIRYSSFTHVDHIWRLRLNISAYDGAYVALAATLGAPLCTRDAKLAAAAAGFIKIVLI